MNVASRTFGLASRLSRTRIFPRRPLLNMSVADVGGCLPLPSRKHEDEHDRCSQQLVQTREYHATNQSPLVLYGGIIILTVAGYVVYRKSRGEPITPYSLTDAKKTYEEHDGKFSRAAFERRQAEKLKSEESQAEKPEK